MKLRKILSSKQNLFFLGIIGLVLGLGSFVNAASTWSAWKCLGGSSADRPWMFNDGRNLVAVVQGLDSQIYYNRMNAKAEWQGWNSMQNEKSGSNPRLVNYEGLIFGVVRKMDGELAYTYKENLNPQPRRKNRNFGKFRWYPSGIKTPSAPAVVAFQDSFYVAIRNEKNQVLINRFRATDALSKLDQNTIDETVNWQNIQGSTNAEPFIGVFNHKLIVAVKGINERIYLNVSNDGEKWRGWQEVPGNGLTPSSPAFVEYQNRLFLVVRGKNNGLWLNTYKDNIWTGWSELENKGRTTAAPMAKIYKENLYLMVKGTNNQLYLSQLNQWNPDPVKPKPTVTQIPNNNLWSGWKQYPDGQTNSALACTIDGGKFYTLVRGIDNKLYVKVGTNPGWSCLGGATLAAPAIAGFNGSVYALVQGTDNGIYINQYKNKWFGWKNIGGKTLSGGALAVYNGKLYAAVRGTNNAVFLNSMNVYGVWSGWKSIGGVTTSEPALTVCNGRLYIGVRGLNNKVYLNTLSNEKYSNWIQVPGNIGTVSGPALTGLDNKSLCIGIRGMDDKVYLSVIPNGEIGKGSNWVEVPGNGRTNAAPNLFTYSQEIQVAIKGYDNNLYLNGKNKYLVK